MVMEWSRYLVLDRCLCDRMRDYHREDIVEAVNRILKRYDFYPLSQRTVLEDLKFMQSDEDFRVKLAKRYDDHTKIYTYEAKGFLHHEPADDRQGERPVECRDNSE